MIKSLIHQKIQYSRIKWLNKKLSNYIKQNHICKTTKEEIGISTITGRLNTNLWIPDRASQRRKGEEEEAREGEDEEKDQ